MSHKRHGPNWCVFLGNATPVVSDTGEWRSPACSASGPAAALKWGCAFFDFDRDADLVVVNGHIHPRVDSTPELHESYRQRPILLHNDEGRLVDVSRQAGPGMRREGIGRGARGR
jgi:hypothetical protein